MIEDDLDAAEALGFVLRDWGAEVATGVSASSVAGKLGPRTRDIAWIVADFDLGARPNGIDCALDLVNLAPQARVLVLSGTFLGSGEPVAKAAGFDFMPKPATPHAIIRWLEAEA